MHPANDPISYPSLRSLKPQSVELLCRLLWVEQEARITMDLERDEVPIAMGLQRRGLISTNRPTKGSILAERRRAVPGSVRTAWLTSMGIAMCRHYKLEPREPLPATSSGFDAFASSNDRVVLQLRSGETVDLSPSEARDLADALGEAANVIYDGGS
jgi:hypothetical protein